MVKYDTQLCDAARGFVSLTLNLVILDLRKQDPDSKTHPAFSVPPLISVSTLGERKISIVPVACYLMYTRTENTTYISSVHHSSPAQKITWML